MNWIRRLLALLPLPKPWEVTPFYGRGAGMIVNHEAALSHSTVWSCVRVISETIATLGWHVMLNRADGTRRRLLSDKLDWILNAEANPQMTAFAWRETAMVHVLLHGNHYSEIERDGAGRPLALWPIDPLRTTVTIEMRGGRKVYRAQPETGDARDIDAQDMIHVHGLGNDGQYGFSVLAMARRSIGSGLALDEMGANFYKNGAHYGTALKHPGKLSENAKDYLKKSFADAYGGAGNAYKTIVLEEGMDATKVSMSMVDAQFLESRKFSVLDICRWFRVPPHKVGDLERGTFSNIEHQSIEFVTDTILPWCRRLEQEIDVKLIGSALQGTKSTRLNIDTMLRGDIATRYSAYEKGRLGGWLSANDVRRLENMNPIPNGDIYLQPMNYMEAGTELPAATAEPAPKPDTTPEEQPANVATLNDARQWRREHV